MIRSKVIFVFLFCLYNLVPKAQCTEAKDSEMAKYMHLTKTQDAQGCSQCAMLALYFCSARYSVEIEDKRKVGVLINECKKNIRNMGQPYCCPEYLNKAPEWGIMAGIKTGSSTNKTSSTSEVNSSTPSTSYSQNNTASSDLTGQLLESLAKLDNGKSGDLTQLANSYVQGQQLAEATNSLVDMFSGSSETNVQSNANSDSTGQLLNALSKLDNGKSSDLTQYANSYAQGQQLAEATNAVIDLFSPSPEEKARIERERLIAEKKAEEERIRIENARIENENNAKKEFNEIAKKYNSSKQEDQTFLVIQIMDSYISNKYNYNVSSLMPDWSNWMISAIKNEDKFASTVFAGKALGFNYNKFNFSINLTPQEAVKLLEKVSESDDVYKPYLGVGFDLTKKTIQEKNKKKKTISREVNTFTLNTVVKESAAEKGDLRKGDVVLKFNDGYVTNLFEEINRNKIGDVIKLTVLRDGKELKKEIVLGKKITDNHKLDAMLILANYYNGKNSGNNPERALYYFTKAAENGSPNAMYALGEIYKNNVYGNKKANVKYKFKKNEEFALEWYLKSIQDLNYSGSLIYTIYKIGSYFEPASFDELTEMYKKGIGCEKSTEKANQIISMKNDYSQNQNK